MMATTAQRVRHRVPRVAVIVSLALLAVGCAADESRDPAPSEAAPERSEPSEPSETGEDVDGGQVAVEDEDRSDTQVPSEPVPARHWAAWMCDELAAPAVEAADVAANLDLPSHDWTENEARLAADGYRGVAVMLERSARAGEQAPPLQDPDAEQLARLYAAYNLEFSEILEQLATEIDQAPSVQQAEDIYNDAASLSSRRSDSPSVAQMHVLLEEHSANFERIDQSLSDDTFAELDEAVERSGCGQEVWSWYFGSW